MNLHEECLLNYLLYPLGLFDSTEALIINNESIKNGLNNINKIAKVQKINYTSNRI